MNRIPGKDNELLLLHLKRVFDLESIEPYEIKKEDTDENILLSPSRPLLLPL